MSRIGWFHCLAGASGDMLLGALVDAGVPLATLQAAVDTIAVERVTLSVDDVTRQGLRATKVNVTTSRSTVIRTWSAVRELLEAAELALPVKATALNAFERLARAEAMVHRTTPELVHFHEVGALDAIADVVGAAAGLHALQLDAVHASPVATGLGMTRTDHGLMPIPSPAVLELLRGAPIYSGGVPHELCTPTGAAVLAAVVTEWGDLPPLVVEAVGVGAGERDVEQVPNVLRLVVGTAATSESSGDSGVVLEANVDDLDPRLWPGVLAALMQAGAADAWLTPIQMKKGRPAVTVSALVTPDSAERVRGVLFRETSTIGVREHDVRKRALDREIVTVTLRDGSEVRVKTARLHGEVVNAVPEFDDVAAAAAASGRAVKSVLAEAVAAAQRQLSTDG